MNKAEMVERLAQRTGMSLKDTRHMVDAIFDPNPGVGLIAAELVRRGKVSISGFGTFETRPRKAREGRNPHTGEVLQLPARWMPTFKAGKPLKETLRQA
ncbi:MAG TPA: HU family DNA-binding protein [Candidatus Polarisedimenticolaceae bacterium]|nr:HU family DNA-binding protein [Candidatus Polarisedimenticolaceae bacterium]